MNPHSQTVLLSTAVTIAFIHTLIGVDHSLPFIALARARSWSLWRALAITALCGVGHVGSSIGLGLVGVWVGASLDQLSWIETIRGGIAAWLLIGFGTLYAVRALWSGRSRSHVHVIDNGNGNVFWSLFLIFVLGPCEPLIPLVMVPASQAAWSTACAVIAVFGGVTIATMLGVVAAGWYGVQQLHMHRLHMHADVLAGAAICISGVLVKAFEI